MIIVLSYDVFEQGTEGVIEWLSFLKANFIKITMNDIFFKAEDIGIDIEQKKMIVRGKDITSDINVFFYRRLHTAFTLKDTIQNPFRRQIEQHVTNEAASIIRYLAHMFADKVWLPDYQSANLNKLIVTQIAGAVGLFIPRSRIINNKKSLLSFLHSSESGIITKPASGVAYFVSGANTYFPYTTLLTEEMIAALPDHFFPSLFQDRIEKQYEIRIFFLDNKIFSFAQLVSEGDHTIDIKERDNLGNRHWVNYNLPLPVQEKIRALMKAINLNTGSLDIIRKRSGEYVFIEVNPIGQYGHMSYYGNFDLEKKIAQWLIKKDHQYATRPEAVLYQ